MYLMLAQTDAGKVELLWRVLTLKDHNTLVPVIGATLLGIAAGIIGTFAYLRRRALMGDALSHATLPGIAIAFMLTGTKSLGVLILGAAVSGIIGVLSVIALRQTRRIKEDAAIGIVLSVFFGVGMVLFSLIQQMATGGQAGLGGFIYGKAAGMVTRDAALIAVAAAVVIIGTLLLFKEFRIICFDQQFAAAQGWPVVWIDLLMMAMVVLVTVVGLQAVGLILVVALLIIPAAAARFWTDNLSAMAAIAGVIGMFSGWLGATISALATNTPTGAIIVIVAGVLFGMSMLFAPHRGMVAGLVRHWLLRRRVTYQNLLRALAEIAEQDDGVIAWVPFARVKAMRGWSSHALAGAARQAQRRRIIDRRDSGKMQLTSQGQVEARRMLRNHRLWEMYLIRYADVAPSHVDRDADEVEHVLSPEIIAELDRATAATGTIPESPHWPGVPT
jgi:manganese/zinc/iron transport system permease protein